MCSSDWSSDVCSSDLAGVLGRALFVAAGAALRPGDGAVLDAPGLPDLLRRAAAAGGTGRQATGAGHDRHRAARPARLMSAAAAPDSCRTSTTRGLVRRRPSALASATAHFAPIPLSHPRYP